MDNTNNLLDRALTVKNETKKNANSADRIGSLFYDIISNSGKIPLLTTLAVASSADKYANDPNYTLTVGDVIALKYNFGNTNSYQTIRINNGTSYIVKLAGLSPVAGDTYNSGQVAAGGIVLYYFDGEFFNQLGSSSVDVNASSRVVGSINNQYIISPNTVQTDSYLRQLRYAFIGMCEDGTIEKIFVTRAPGIGGTPDMFTTNKIALFENILYAANNPSVGWTPGTVLQSQLFQMYNIIGMLWTAPYIYNLSGVLESRGTLLPTVSQQPFYVGGIQYGQYFIPDEWSLTLRDTNKVYKRILRIALSGSNPEVFFINLQPVFKYISGQWQIISQ